MDGDWIVYGTTRCPYTLRALDLLSNRKIIHTFVNLDNYENGREEIKQISKQQTIPVIYYNGKLIGGYTQLEQIF